MTETDPEQILRETLNPLLKGAFEGSPDQREGHLERLILVARAVMRFAREIAPIVAPGTSRENLLRFTAQALAPAVQEVIARAGVNPAQGRVLIAAFALGLEAGSAESDVPRPPEDIGWTRWLARILEFAQDLRERGLDRTALGARLDKFLLEEADSSKMQAGVSPSRFAIEAILTSFYPPNIGTKSEP
jgi:hypothetical protein